MILTRFDGGLGNQMFQYAMAKAIAQKSGAEIVFDLRPFGKDSAHFGFSLQNFLIHGRIAEICDFFRFPRIATDPLRRWTRRRSADPTGTYRFQKDFGFNGDFLRPTKHAYFEGYWQSEKYFKSVAGQIRQEFQPKSSPSEKNKLLIEQMKNVQSVSIHVRRGDYLEPANSAIHGVCGAPYYHSAITKMKSELGTPQFFVFSDDLAWSKSEFNQVKDITFVDGNEGENSYWDLHLMSSCQHHIIANSSFSWWGAWLNDGIAKSGFTIAPKNWFADKTKNADDIVPERWLRLDQAAV